MWLILAHSLPLSMLMSVAWSFMVFLSWFSSPVGLEGDGSPPSLGGSSLRCDLEVDLVLRVESGSGS